MPFKAIEIRLYPTKEQEVLLHKTLGCTRFVYNYFLAKKIKHINSKNKNKKPYNYVQWCHEIVLLKRKKNYTWLAEVEHCTLQQSLRDLNTAFRNCFKHNKGFPKFHKKGIKNSFRTTHPTTIRIEGNHINLPKLKLVKFRGNKHLFQDIKINNITVKLKAGKWFAYILTEDNTNYVDEPPVKQVGIDVGVVNPLTIHFRDEQGHHYQFFGKEFSKKLKKLEKKRHKVQRTLARKKKASKNRVKTKLRLQKAFLKETNVRKDFIEKTSHYLSTTFKVIKFEDLRLQAMTTHGGNYKRKMNDGMRRLGLGKLMDRTIDKAEKFGSIVNFVNPRCTSQECPKCHHICRENRRSQSKFKCVNCGHAKHADKIAAFNIYKRQAA